MESVIALKELTSDPEKEQESNVYDEDEWEYEYDESEKEEFFVTLDLSSYTLIPERPPPKSKAKSQPPAVQKEDVEQEIAVTPQVEPSEVTKPTSSLRKKPAQSSLQILDFKSKNPIISYQGQIYTGEWVAPIGTDIILSTNPERISNHKSANPLFKPTPEPSFVAVSGLHLVARPNILKRRYDHLNTLSGPSSTKIDSTEIKSSFRERLLTKKRALGQLDIPNASTTDEQQPKQQEAEGAILRELPSTTVE